MPPERWAALRADLPLTTVSRGAPPARNLLPILVTESHSDMMIDVVVIVDMKFDELDDDFVWPRR